MILEDIVFCFFLCTNFLYVVYPRRTFSLSSISVKCFLVVTESFDKRSFEKLLIWKDITWTSVTLFCCLKTTRFLHVVGVTSDNTITHEWRRIKKEWYLTIVFSLLLWTFYMDSLWTLHIPLPMKKRRNLLVK